MKVIKIVGEGAERRTYVAGGPECPNGIYLKHPDGTRSAFTSHINCPACHGTGLIPVELWPDAEKAEWLVAEYLSGNERAAELLRNVVELLLGGGNLSDLLPAAVIAVAEEER